MSRTHDGYVVDVAYIDSVSADLCPAWLSMSAVLHGQPPLPDGPLVWAELGYGNGLAACVVGAANAGVTVWGCDVNPAHVERARSLAARAGLGNCTFDLASFAEVAADPTVGPAEVDVVVVNGVYSWVSAENRRHIAEFVRRRLRPGGLVHLTYESPTGWSAMTAAAEALRLVTRADGRGPLDAFPDAYRLLAAVREAGGDWLPAEGHEARTFADLATADGRYAVHEYLASHFEPLMFDQVMEVMGSAGCEYLGSIELTDHRPEWWVAADLVPLVAGTADPVRREMVRDLCTQRALRRSLFRRGLAQVPPAAHLRHLRGLQVCGLGVPLAEGATAPVPAGQVALDVAYHQPLVGTLAQGPLDVDRVVALKPEVHPLDAADALAVLVAGGYAAPRVTRPATDETRDACRRLNLVLVDENLHGADHRCLAVPELGSVVAAEYVELFTLGAVWQGAPADADALAAEVLAHLARQDRAVFHEGAAVTDPEAALAVARDRVQGALARLAAVLVPLGAPALR